MIRTSIVHFLHSLPSQSSPIQFWCECHWQVMQLWFSFIYLQECPINHNLVFTLTKHLNLNRVNEWCNLLRVIYISISYKFLYITKNLITPYSTCKYRSYWSTLWDQKLKGAIYVCWNRLMVFKKKKKHYSNFLHFSLEISGKTAFNFY